MIGLTPCAHQPLIEVYHRVREVCEQSCPSAKVTYGADEPTILVEYRTRDFQVYAVSKDGKIAESLHPERGPTHDGFLLQVALQPGKYQGAAVIPQDMRRPYWTTYVNAVSLPDKDEHLHIQLSYGSRTDRELLQQLKAAIGVKSRATERSIGPSPE